ncbi:MAG: hypothetical protein WCA08_04540 [Desulfoferrobacter sp.]
MATLLIIAFYLLAGIAVLGLLGIMIVYTIAEHDARFEKQPSLESRQYGVVGSDR